jgi:phosphonate transport system ATP-binding protein
MIVINNLSKSYSPNLNILSSIHGTIHQGDFIVIIGSSGSGKSTLLKCLSGQEKWSSGSLTYHGKEYFPQSWFDRIRLAKQFAWLEDTPFLNQKKSAVKNVLKGRAIQLPFWRVPTNLFSRNEHILGMDYLENVGLLDKGHLQISELSGGEKQRVAIAKALIQGNKVLFADDPFKGLDLRSIEMIMNDLKLLVKTKQLTIVCVLNQLDLVARYASRIWGIVDGQIELDIPARSLITQEKKRILNELK